MSSMNGARRRGSPSFRSSPGATNGTSAAADEQHARRPRQEDGQARGHSLFSSARSSVAWYLATNRTRHAAMPRSKSVKYARMASTTHQTP